MPTKNMKTTPVDAAEAERNAAIEAQIAKRNRDNTVPLPNGIRMSVNAAVEPRFNGMNATQMLGQPESILLDPKPDHKYVWKKRQDNQTSAWVRSGILRPIEASEIDPMNPLAEFFETILATGEKVVAWESLALFEMSPKWVARIYQHPEMQSVQRIASQGEAFAGEVNSASGGAYKGVFNVSKK
jgi:hypothetical protein